MPEPARSRVPFCTVGFRLSSGVWKPGYQSLPAYAGRPKERSNRGRALLMRVSRPILMRDAAVTVEPLYLWKVVRQEVID